MGDIASGLVKLLVSVYIFMLLFSYFSAQRIQSAVDDLVYTTAESVSTMGVLSDNLYEVLEDTVNRYSNGMPGSRYLVQLKLEKQIGPNVFDVFYESSEDRKQNNSRKGKVVGRPLDVGDRITVYVEDRSSTLLGKLLSVPLFTRSGGEQYIRSSQTGIVAKRMNDMVKGYDVIADLNSNPFTYINRIDVITKVNQVGYSYSVPSNLPTYRTYSISDASNINYIFPQGEFFKAEDVVGGQRIVTYSQRY